MNLNFELFEEGQRERHGGRLHVTLSKDQKLFLNARALKALGDPAGVALMFDRRQQVIGVMPSSVNRPHAYVLRSKRNMGAARMISAKNFCQHYEISPPETVAFPTASVNGDGILLLDLHSAKTVSRKHLPQRAQSTQR